MQRKEGRERVCLGVKPLHIGVGQKSPLIVLCNLWAAPYKKPVQKSKRKQLNNFRIMILLPIKICLDCIYSCCHEEILSNDSNIVYTIFHSIIVRFNLFLAFVNNYSAMVLSLFVTCLFLFHALISRLYLIRWHRYASSLGFARSRPSNWHLNK